MHAKPSQTSRVIPARTSERQSSTITQSCSHKDPTETPEPSHGSFSRISTGPAEISEKNRVRLLHRLDSTDQPFRVNTVPLSRKRKRSGTRLQVQDDLFEARLAVQYKVEPEKDWESLRRYKRFTGKKGYAGGFTYDDEAVLMAGTVGSESIATGDFILVSHSIIKDTLLDSLSDWKAKVLEVRAFDAEHVYVRVSWLNRPEDLTGGRWGHHGERELVPTNQMDVINALSVNGTFQLKHYDKSEDDDRKNASGADEYFWRQTFDFTTKSLLIRPEPNSV